VIQKTKVLHIAPIINHRKKSQIDGDGDTKKYFTIVGLSNSVRKLAEGQNQNNMDVGIITTRVSSRAAPESIFWLSSADKSILNLFLNDPFHEVAHEFGIPDVLHAHDIYELKQLAFIFHAKRRGIKVFVSPRGTLSPVAISTSIVKKTIYIRTIFSIFVRYINGFVALNEGESRAIRKVYKNKKIITISNGVDNNDKHLLKNKNNYQNKLKQKIINIGFLGRFEVHIKGLDNLLNSYIQYQKITNNIVIKLIFIGEHTKKNIDSNSFFQSELNKLKNREMVEMIPSKYNDEKWEELSKLDIFVHPSRSEGMPNAVLEAMSMGIPCMVSPQTNIGDIIKAANCGWVVENDETSLLNFFLDIEKKNKSTLNELGKNGLRYSRDKLNWKTVSSSSYY
jgi:glycosyltransferase involved in cell wall biosynthesis